MPPVPHASITAKPKHDRVEVPRRSVPMFDRIWIKLVAPDVGSQSRRGRSSWTMPTGPPVAIKLVDTERMPCMRSVPPPA